MAVDARVRYTKMIIKKTFIELLKTKQPNKITVKEICECAEINRSTFYKYYKDVFDLFDKMKDEQHDEFLRLIINIKEKGARDTLIETLEKIKKNKDVYLTLLLSVSVNDVLSCTFKNYYDEMLEESKIFFKEIPEEKHMWLVYYLFFGSSGIIHAWIDNDMRQSCEEIADLIVEFIDGTKKSLVK